MKSKLSVALLLSFIVMAWVSEGLAQSTLTIPPIVPSPASPIGGFACPDGDGTPAVQTWINNAPIPVTIFAVIRDGNGDPIANYPSHDIWLVSRGSCDCSANTDLVYADFNTNALGETAFNATLYPGNCCEVSYMDLIIAGTLLTTASVDFGIQFNTVDFICDGIIDDDDRLAMIPKYASWDYCADLNQDGLFTPADAMVLAKHTFPLLSHHCPP